MKRKMSDASRVSMQMPKEGIGGGLSENQIVVYQPDSVMRLEVRFDGETVWLPQPQIAELFSCSVENVRLHLKNIYAIGELDKAATSKESLEVRKEGMRNVTRKFIYYNLDAIISIGYRVNSIVGVRFRQWATRVIKDRMLARTMQATQFAASVVPSRRWMRCSSRRSWRGYEYIVGSRRLGGVLCYGRMASELCLSLVRQVLV